MPVLQARGLSKSFPTPDGELAIFRDLDLQLESAEALAVVGPSGCGKSTLLHCLGTLDPPTAGSLKVDGTDPYSLSAAALAHFRNTKIGFLFQEAYLMPQLTAVQNVLVPVLAHGKVDTQASERAADLLDRVGLAGRAAHLPGQLSGGERARVALARALIQRPLLLLADEPTGALDPATAATIADLLLELQQQQQLAMIVVTHSREFASRLPRQLALAASAA